MGAITTCRTQLAALLAAALPDGAVWPHPQPVDQPMRHTLLIGTGAVRPPSTAYPGRVVELDVWVVSPLTDPGAADDDLDDLLDDVLAAIDASGTVAWSRAERGVYRETHPAYRIETEQVP